MNENYFAVIMAGGIGSRFWPVSTPDNPKQFHDMLGTGRSLIQSTFDRLLKLIPQKNILVATNQRYKELVMEHLPEINSDQLLLEPAMRNTAPCILYSALKIANKSKDAVMIVAPSDHYIENESEFVNRVQAAFDACSTGEFLMCLGIKPSGPNTGYGYIKSRDSKKEISEVEAFIEKPDRKTARHFVEEGNYFWNAGIFIWSVQAILRAFELHLPEMSQLLGKGGDLWNTGGELEFIQEHYPMSENISIDYGIMEKAENVCVMPAEFGWNDLGTWGSLFEKLPKDDAENAVLNANCILKEARGNMIRTQKGKNLVVQGLEDYIIIETSDTLMIVPKDAEQQIKEISKEAEKEWDR